MNNRNLANTVENIQMTWTYINVEGSRTAYLGDA